MDPGGAGARRGSTPHVSGNGEAEAEMPVIAAEEVRGCARMGMEGGGGVGGDENDGGG